MSLKLTYQSLDPSAEFATTEWQFGFQFAAELLEDINLAAHRKAPFKIEQEDYTIYWAGTVLRIDIKKTAVSD